MHFSIIASISLALLASTGMCMEISVYPGGPMIPATGVKPAPGVNPGGPIRPGGTVCYAGSVACGTACCNKDLNPSQPEYCANANLNLCCASNLVETNGICCPSGSINCGGQCCKGECVSNTASVPPQMRKRIVVCPLDDSNCGPISRYVCNSYIEV